MITEQQYQRLMNEYAKSGVLGTAAMKAGMHRETASKYLRAGQGRSRKSHGAGDGRIH